MFRKPTRARGKLVVTYSGPNGFIHLYETQRWYIACKMDHVKPVGERLVVLEAWKRRRITRAGIDDWAVERVGYWKNGRTW